MNNIQIIEIPIHDLGNRPNRNGRIYDYSKLDGDKLKDLTCQFLNNRFEVKDAQIVDGALTGVIHVATKDLEMGSSDLQELAAISCCTLTSKLPITDVDGNKIEISFSMHKFYNPDKINNIAKRYNEIFGEFGTE